MDDPSLLKNVFGIESGPSNRFELESSYFIGQGLAISSDKLSLYEVTESLFKSWVVNATMPALPILVIIVMDVKYYGCTEPTVEPLDINLD